MYMHAGRCEVQCGGASTQCRRSARRKRAPDAKSVSASRQFTGESTWEITRTAQGPSQTFTDHLRRVYSFPPTADDIESLLPTRFHLLVAKNSHQSHRDE